MSFFSAFTGSAQRKDAKRGYADSTRMLSDGMGKAVGEIDQGYAGADKNFGRARGALGDAYGKADGFYGNAPDYLEPYAQTGSRANALYSDALGLNGVDAQRSFGQNYAASDPFRAQNAGMASEALMKVLNARGMSGSGYAAEAVARQNLQQGSQDYQNYLAQLSGLQSQGQNTAAQRTQFGQNMAGQRANLATGYGNAMAGTYGDQAGMNVNRGNALADLYYGNAQQNANMRTGLANAVAQSRSVGVNNMLGLASTIGGAVMGGFTPGAGGLSAFGNISKAMSGGGMK